MSSAKWVISVVDFEEVIDRNPENADFSNPTGVSYGLASYLRAESASGVRYVGPRLGCGAAENFEYTVAPFAAKLGEDWNPANDAEWSEDRPCYGSAAYEANQPFEVAMEERGDW